MQNQSLTQELKQYRIIFICLVVLTAISVGIHYMHLPMNISIGLILLVALIQAALSVSYFMHLISEKKVIYFILIMTAFFFIEMGILIYSGRFSHPEGSLYVH